MFASEAIPLNHPRDGDPEHCCSGGKHNFHFRPGAPQIPGHLIWCCCKSLLDVIEDPETIALDVQAGCTAEEVARVMDEARIKYDKETRDA